MATLPFRFRFFFQAALDGVRPPKPVFMILDVRYLDPKTSYSFKKVFGQHPHTCSRAFSTRCCPSSLTPKLRCSRASQVTCFQACRWCAKKVIHAAIFITTDIVFTKNGYDFTQPWILMRKSDMLEVYKARYPASTLQPIYFRKRTI